MPPSEAAGWESTVARHAPALIVGYFALHVLLRVTAPGGLGLDEAEQMVATQSLEWGYGAQPPLYTWAQWAVFQVTGPGKLGLALMKNALLAIAYLALWAAALRATGDRRLAMVAAFSLILLPPISWEAQRALTHTVLAVAVSALTVLLVGRVFCKPAARDGAIRARPPSWGEVVALGVLAAAGILAKSNYAFLLIGLAGALVLTRRASWRYGLALGLAAALLAAPVRWMLTNPALATQSVGKLRLAPEEGASAAVAGLLALAEAVPAFAVLMLAAHGALFWWRPPRSDPAGRAFGRFLALALGLGLAAVAVVVAASGATEVKARWLQPLLAPLPLAATLIAASRIDPPATRAFLSLVGFAALAISVALPLNLRFGGNNPSNQSEPFALVGPRLPPGPALALAASDPLAGNIRLVRPDLALLTPQKPALSLGGSPGFAIWGSRDAPRPPPPPALVELARRLTGQDITALRPRGVTTAFPPPHEDRTFHLRWVPLAPRG